MREIKKINDTDSVLISDKVSNVLLAKDLSCVVRVTSEGSRVYFSTENIVTRAIGADYHHSREDNWYNVVATVSPYRIDGLPMI